MAKLGFFKTCMLLERLLYASYIKSLDYHRSVVIHGLLCAVHICNQKSHRQLFPCFEIGENCSDGIPGNESIIDGRDSYIVDETEFSNQCKVLNSVKAVL